MPSLGDLRTLFGFKNSSMTCKYRLLTPIKSHIALYLHSCRFHQHRKPDNYSSEAIKSLTNQPIMSDFLKGCPEPPTEPGRYSILSSTAGVRVSPLCLGAGTFGTAWADISTSVDEEKSFKILDALAEAGGNFIDCANVYQNGQSETVLGKWMASRDNRDMMVVATKYMGDYCLSDLGPGRTVNYSGNHKKSMFLSL